MKAAHNEHIFIEEINKGYFQIDSEGRIWRIAKRNNQYRTFVKIKEVELKCMNKFGYIRIKFNRKGRNYHCYGHRIIWIFFNGEIPTDKQINHKNGIKTDNRLKNLELVTASQNTKHSFINGLQYSLRGEKSPTAKLTSDNVREIRLRYSRGELQRELAQDFNISIAETSQIINRKRWTHIT